MDDWRKLSAGERQVHTFRTAMLSLGDADLVKEFQVMADEIQRRNLPDDNRVPKWLPQQGRELWEADLR